MSVLKEAINIIQTVVLVLIDVVNLPKQTNFHISQTADIQWAEELCWSMSAGSRATGGTFPML